jgi:hypothetical protein
MAAADYFFDCLIGDFFDVAGASPVASFSEVVVGFLERL